MLLFPCPEKMLRQKGWSTVLKKSRSLGVYANTTQPYEPLYTVDGNVNECSHYGNQYGGSSKN
jgi:hypothetical protein